MSPRVAGFMKVRNEIIREWNLGASMLNLNLLCDCGVICDDASTDGTREALHEYFDGNPRWKILEIDPREQNFRNELRIKQQMLDLLHSAVKSGHLEIDWILWQDGDEVLDVHPADFYQWLEEHGPEADVWAFHYTQFWRSANWARTDSGFDEGWFWKLWRYHPDLSFDFSKGELHQPQFPQQYVQAAVNAAMRGGSHERAKRAPFEIYHTGNYGKNLVLKAIQYRNSGPLQDASLERHLYFGQPGHGPTPTYRRLTKPLPFELQGSSLVGDPKLHFTEEPPMPFTPEETQIIERMRELKSEPGLFTICVPTYNRGYILDQTLQSVLDQTYKHWVCVVLDDGSTDDTAAVMRRWQDKDPRFFYCRYTENRGGVAMNEIGMRLACEFGEFWTRLGSDDRFEPHKLAVDFTAFQTGAQILYGPYRDKHETFIGPELRNPPCDARGQLLSRGFAAGWANIAIKTDALAAVLNRHGRFCDDVLRDGKQIRNMEDWPVNWRLALQFEFTWRGLFENGSVVVGPRFVTAQLGDEYGFGPLRHDAIWRIAADGASQKQDVCAPDSALVVQLIDNDSQQFQPAPRTETRIEVLPLTKAE